MRILSSLGARFSAMFESTTKALLRCHAPLLLLESCNLPGSYEMIESSVSPWSKLRCWRPAHVDMAVFFSREGHAFERCQLKHTACIFARAWIRFLFSSPLLISPVVSRKCAGPEDR